MQSPAKFVFEYVAPSSFISKTCKIAKNTTDYWSKTLYTQGQPKLYNSVIEFTKAIVAGTQTGITTAKGDVFSADILEKALSFIDVAGINSKKSLPDFQIQHMKDPILRCKFLLLLLILCIRSVL